MLVGLVDIKIFRMNKALKVYFGIAGCTWATLSYNSCARYVADDYCYKVKSHCDKVLYVQNHLADGDHLIPNFVKSVLFPMTLAIYCIAKVVVVRTQ